MTRCLFLSSMLDGVLIEKGFVYQVYLGRLIPDIYIRSV